MSNPIVVSVSPGNLATDVIMGTVIVITFDQVINTATLNSSSFQLNAPGGTAIVAPGNLIANYPNTTVNPQYIQGAFTFTTVSGATVATFTPSVPLTPNVTYTAIIVGGSSLLASANAVQNLTAEVLTNTYQWTFQTGNLNVVVPPTASPLPGPLTTYIDPKNIQIIPMGELLNQPIQAGYTFEIIFPGPINQSSIDLSEVQCSIESMLNDPTIPVPTGLVATLTFDLDNPAGIICTISAA